MKAVLTPILFAIIVLIFGISLFAQRPKSALLPATEARRLTKQCSRPSPENFTDTWEPGKSDIEKMESKLSDIKKLKVKDCCIQGAVIEDPDAYYMQYAGIILDGHKLIYISAISKSQPTQLSAETVGGKEVLREVPSDSWKTNAFVICDGGNAWGVLYDPASGKFFDLAINGIA